MTGSSDEFESLHDLDVPSHLMGEPVPPGLPIFTEKVPSHLINRADIDIPRTTQGLQDRVAFKPSHGRWQIARDIVGMVRRGHGDEGDETYQDKLLREARKGKTESATYGMAQIMGEEVVMYAMNWDFFAGSLGVVAGEKFQAAARLAIDKKLPMVSVYASSGVRQHENFAGLAQMTRMVEAIRQFRESSTEPHVAVLVGNVWGGISASAVPNADFVVALSGTDFGFAGPNVIEAYDGVPVPDGSQSSEANLLDRNIDVIVQGEDALIDYLGAFMKARKLPDRQHVLNNESGPFVRNISEHRQGRIFHFGNEGIGRPFLDLRAEAESTIALKMRQKELRAEHEETLIDQYQTLMSDANRVDLEFILQHVFTEAVPFYNHIIEGEYKRYPSVIGALGRIGTQPFMIVGTQPSYRRLGENVIKQPANPQPEDFEYMERMLEMGARLRLPALFVTDTLGAKPSLENEQRGQSRAIARLILKGIDYPHPAISLVTGALGSGGGLATTPLADHVMMLEGAMAFVAEPRSAASILYKTATPTRDQIKTTLATMRATALDQLALGLIDEVVEELPNPYETADNIHKAILVAYIGVSALSNKKLHSRRQHRIRNLRAFEIMR